MVNASKKFKHWKPVKMHHNLFTDWYWETFTDWIARQKEMYSIARDCVEKVCRSFNLNDVCVPSFDVFYVFAGCQVTHSNCFGIDVNIKLFHGFM